MESAKKSSEENTLIDDVFADKTATDPPTTSTPIDGRRGKKTSLKKRKRSSPPKSPRRTRLRSRMSDPSKTIADESGSRLDGTEEGQDQVMVRIANAMDRMNDNMANMKETIRETVSEAIEPLSVRLDTNTRRMDKIEANQRKEIQAINFKIDELSRSRRGAQYVWTT